MCIPCECAPYAFMHPVRKCTPRMYTPRKCTPRKCILSESASPKSASVPIMYRHNVRTILYYGIFALSFSAVMGIFRSGAILHVACTKGFRSPNLRGGALRGPLLFLDDLPLPSGGGGSVGRLLFLLLLSHLFGSRVRRSWWWGQRWWRRRSLSSLLPLRCRRRLGGGLVPRIVTSPLGGGAGGWGRA